MVSNNYRKVIGMFQEALLHTEEIIKKGQMKDPKCRIRVKLLLTITATRNIDDLTCVVAANVGLAI